MHETLTIAGRTVLWVAREGEPLHTEQHAVDLVGEAFGVGAELVAVPVERLAPDFLDLATRKAGLFVQKLVNYRLGVAFVGDLGPHLEACAALRDFVRESHRGRAVAFVPDLDALAAHLA